MVLLSRFVGAQSPGSQPALSEAVLRACSVLLPAACCDVLLRQDAYAEPYVCNFLGLTARGSVPAHVRGEPGVVLLQVSAGSLVPAPRDAAARLSGGTASVASPAAAVRRTPLSPQEKLLRELTERAVESKLALTLPRTPAFAATPAASPGSVGERPAAGPDGPLSDGSGGSLGGRPALVAALCAWFALPAPAAAVADDDWLAALREEWLAHAAVRGPAASPLLAHVVNRLQALFKLSRAPYNTAPLMPAFLEVFLLPGFLTGGRALI
jgi:hypothetical protein